MLEQRSTQDEIMDDFSIGDEAMRLTLEELDFINRWLGGHTVTKAGLDSILHSPFLASFPLNKLKIADLGSGGGDNLRLMARWARQRHLPATFVGLDANPYIVEYSAAQSRDYPEISYQQVDVFSEEFARQQYDIITCSLFLHHFPDELLIKLLAQLHKQARVAVLINDLHRHPLAYYSIKWLTAAFSRSYLVKHDAAVSVARSFTRADWERILAAAGVPAFRLKWRWAFRWQLVFGPFLEKQTKNV